MDWHTSESVHKLKKLFIKNEYGKAEFLAEKDFTRIGVKENKNILKLLHIQKEEKAKDDSKKKVC